MEAVRDRLQCVFLKKKYLKKPLTAVIKSAAPVPEGVQNGKDETSGSIRRLDNLTSEIPIRKLLKAQVLGIK